MGKNTNLKKKIFSNFLCLSGRGRLDSTWKIFIVIYSVDKTFSHQPAKVFYVMSTTLFYHYLHALLSPIEVLKERDKSLVSGIRLRSEKPTCPSVILTPSVFNPQMSEFTKPTEIAASRIQNVKRKREP
jgi:hypothetical protein